MIFGRKGLWSVLVLVMLMAASVSPAAAARTVPIRKYNVKPIAVSVGTEWTGSATVGRKRGTLVLLQRGRSEDGKFTTAQRLRTGKGGRLTFTVRSPERGRWYWQLFVPPRKGYYPEMSYPKRVDVADSFPKRLSGTYSMAQVPANFSGVRATGPVTFVYDAQRSDDKSVVYAVESLGVDWRVSGTGACPFEGGGTLTDPLLAHGLLTIPRAQVGQGWAWTARIGLEFGFPSPFIATRACDGDTVDFGEVFGYVRGQGLLNLGDVSDVGGVQQVTNDLGRITGSNQYTDAGYVQDVEYSWQLDLTGSELAPR